MFLMANGVQEMAVDWIQVAKQFQRGLGFIRVYSENLYTAKISTYTIHYVSTFFVFTVMLASVNEMSIRIL